MSEVQASITNKETACHHRDPGERCELYQWLWVAAELSMNPNLPVSFLSGYHMFSSDAQFLSRFQLHLLILGGAVHSCSLDRSAFCLLEPCGNVPALGIIHTHVLTNKYPGTCISLSVQLFQNGFVWLCIFQATELCLTVCCYYLKQWLSNVL